MRKRPILLLELSIAMILMAAIVGILFSSYRAISIAQLNLKQEKESVLNRQRFHLRLLLVLSHIQSFDAEQLFFAYDNGADVHPSFRGVVDGLFYIEKGKLFLATWPEKGDPRLEILFEDVTTFSLEFFNSEKGVWQKGYPDEKPFMVRVYLNGEKIPFFL